MIEDKDLRVAVQRGLITESQAAGLTAIADARRNAREGVEPGEEPFVLFKGFNEIFVVIGLVILFSGWIGVSAAFGAEILNPGGLDTILIAAVTLAGLGFVQRYFTIKRRMIAPSMALAIMTAFTAAVLGWALANELGLSGLVAHAAGASTLVAWMLYHYRVFKVPFDAAIIAGAVFWAAWSVLALAGLLPETGSMLFRATQGGPMAIASIVFGLICFATAMRFDMSDPHRVSTRSTTGFWLHVVAAPPIVNTIAGQLIGQGQAAELLLLAVLVLLAVVAIVIDRRSFLISGAGFAVWLMFSLFDGSPMVILLLGFGLVGLGSQWDRLRGGLMNALPDFPGKDRLPPYGSPA
ncbi:MAG: hypothetical protein R3D60_00810 [Paracoccaceae bacterium]